MGCDYSLSFCREVQEQIMLNKNCDDLRLVCTHIYIHTCIHAYIHTYI